MKNGGWSARGPQICPQIRKELSRMLSTHVLDLVRGAPAAGVRVRLLQGGGDAPRVIAEADTDRDGRVPSPFGGELAPGWYELRFAAGAYFAAAGQTSFYDEIPIR